MNTPAQLLESVIADSSHYESGIKIVKKVAYWFNEEGLGSMNKMQIL